MKRAFFLCQSPVRCEREGSKLASNLELTQTLCPGGRRGARAGPAEVTAQRPSLTRRHAASGQVCLPEHRARVGQDWLRLPTFPEIQNMCCFMVSSNYLVRKRGQSSFNNKISLQKRAIFFFFFFNVRRMHSCIRKSFLAISKYLRG